MGKLSRILLIIGLTVIVGCIETKDEFTVNPDGSGKVLHELTFVPMNLGQVLGGAPALASQEAAGAGDERRVTGDERRVTGGQPGGPGGAGGGASPALHSQAQLKQSVKEILRKSTGVDAWKDVSYNLTDQGKIHFRGTAYFADINNLSLHSGISEGDTQISLTRNALGEIAIEMKSKSAATSLADQTGGRTPPPAVSEEKLNELVRQARTQYEQARVMLQGFFAGLKSETILHVPGRVKEVSNFEQVDDHTVRLIVDGPRLLAIVDRLMQDETWLKEQIRTGKDPFSSGPESDLAINEMLFGQRAPIRVVVEPAAGAVFDYNAEVTAARANYQAMLGQLGLEGVEAEAEKPVETAPEPTVSEITPAHEPQEEETGMKVVVGGVRLVMVSDFGRGIMPLGRNSGYTLSLIAELPEPVIKISGGRVEKALTDSGKDLLPKEQWDRKIKYPMLAGDNKTAVFDVDLLLPDETARGLEEVSGVLEYLTAGGSKEADLGVIALEVGAKGAACGAVISSIEADPWQNNATMLGIRVDLPPEAIESVAFSTDSGTKLDITLRSSASLGGGSMLKFSVKGQVPKSARVVLNVFEELKKNEIPFRIRNVSLTGQRVQQ